VSITVFLADDHTIVRDGLRYLLEAQKDIRVVGEAGDGRDAVRKVKTLQPDIVIMDIFMAELNGIEATAQICRECPSTRVIMLSMQSSSESILRALKAGASGYLLKQSPPEELIEALHELHNGGAPMSSSIARMVVASFNKNKAEKNEYELTEREREVLILLSEGYRYKDIAAKLFVSISTIRSHIYNIYEKLHVHNRTEALIKFNKRN